MKDWKGIWEKAGDVNSTKAYVTNDKTSPWILNECSTNINILHTA
jgi:hypothetical protein